MRFSLLILLIIISGCGNSELKVQDSSSGLSGETFTIQKKNGNIRITPMVNDTIPATLVFDTGNGAGLILKSSFLKKLGKDVDGAVSLAISGYNDSFYRLTDVQDTISIRIGKKIIFFSTYSVVEDDDPLGIILNDADGLLPIPDNIHGLSILFSHNMLVVDSLAIDLDKCDFVTSFYRTDTKPFVVKGFPFTIHDDSLTNIQDDFFIDTGYRGDICINGASESDPKGLLGHLSDYHLINRIKKTPDDVCKIYSFHDKNLLERPVMVEANTSSGRNRYEIRNSIIGMEILNDFDIYMDFDKDSIWFKKNDCAGILDSPLLPGDPVLAGRYDSESKEYTIMFMRKDSPFSAAGIIPGDVIVSLNGKPFDHSTGIKDGHITDTLHITLRRANDIIDYTITGQNNQRKRQ